MHTIFWYLQVLICAPSNVAVDNIVEKIKPLTEVCVLGFVSPVSLSSEMEQHDDYGHIESAFENLVRFN